MGDPVGGAVEAPAAEVPTDEDIATMENAFGQAMGSAVMQVAMGSMSILTETLSEIENEQ